MTAEQYERAGELKCEIETLIELLSNIERLIGNIGPGGVKIVFWPGDETFEDCFYLESRWVLAWKPWLAEELEKRREEFDHL